MLRGLQLTIIVPLALALCGCNQVVSSEPWFTEADKVGAPQLREGVWTFTGDPDCHFDESKPTEQWPDCANAGVVRGDEWLGIDWATQGEGRRARRTFAKWVSAPSSLFGGDPPIVQLKTEQDAGDATSAKTDADSEAQRFPYQYMAVRPIEFDGAGKVIRLEMWSVVCGPLPPPETGPQQQGEHAKQDENGVEYSEVRRSVTDKPFPGLTIVDQNCIAESKEALRNAAKMSEALSDKPLPSLHWVRDGYR